MMKRAIAAIAGRSTAALSGSGEMNDVSEEIET